MNDTTTPMSEGQDDNQGGHGPELGRAATRMADALAAGDAVELRAGASDHAAALGSQATAMAAAIAKPLYGRLDAIGALVKELAEIVTNARQADLTWRTEERMTRDAQSNRLYDELDKLIAASEETRSEVGKASTLAGEAMVEVEALAGVVSDLGEGLNALVDRVLLVEQTPGTSPALLKGQIRLERRVMWLTVAMAAFVLLMLAVFIRVVVG